MKKSFIIYEAECKKIRDALKKIAETVKTDPGIPNYEDQEKIITVIKRYASDMEPIEEAIGLCVIPEG
jgi:hypothetical protein